MYTFLNSFNVININARFFQVRGNVKEDNK